MRKTIALFGLAFVLIVAALVVGLRQPASPIPISHTHIEPISTPPPPPPLPLADGRTTISMGDLVRLDGSLSNGFVRATQAGSLLLLLDLVGKESASTTRAPMAVAMVIDRSGSMAGDKIRQARLAAKQFASRLGEDDQLAIVTYSSDYSVDLALTTVKGQRQRIDRVIDDILDGGGTDIGGGMQAGLSALRTANAGTVKRLLLVSDGNANQGITDPNALAAIAKRAKQDGITVSTLGVGLDFNEDLLVQMSQNAGGGYYYAKDGEAIATALDKELAGLKELAARNVEVGLELANGVTISEVYGYRTEMRRGRTVITVGDIASNERRRVLVQLNVGSTAEGKLDVANVVLSYAAPASEDVREHQGALSAVATLDEFKLAANEKREVREAHEAALAARSREQAAFSYQSGNAAEAAAHLRRQIVETKKKNTELKSLVLEEQVHEMEDALRSINTAAADSDEGKDLVKREKLRARQVFAY
jgi:Ca-activated chloride channel homolog